MEIGFSGVVSTNRTRFVGFYGRQQGFLFVFSCCLVGSASSSSVSSSAAASATASGGSDASSGSRASGAVAGGGPIGIQTQENVLQLVDFHVNANTTSQTVPFGFRFTQFAS